MKTKPQPIDITIKFRRDTAEALKFLKWAFKVKTYDDVVNKLISKNAQLNRKGGIKTENAN